MRRGRPKIHTVTNRPIERARRPFGGAHKLHMIPLNKLKSKNLQSIIGATDKRAAFVALFKGILIVSFGAPHFG